MPSKTSDKGRDAKYDRYSYCQGSGWGWLVEDDWKVEEVAWCDEENDAIVIAQCLNLIEHTRGDF